MGLFINRHGPGSRSGRKVSNNAEAGWRIFPGNRDRAALAVRGIRLLNVLVVSSGVHTLSNFQAGENFPTIAIDYNHFFVVTP